ncbi:MAG: hypothetical protein Kow0063_34970 [Anaerolineae bacterium]
MGWGREQTRHQDEIEDSVQEVEQRTGYRRFLQELRGGGRYVDLEKDTQFSDAWIVLAVLLSLAGLLLNNQLLTAAAASLLVIIAISGAWSRLSLFGLHYHRHFSETRAFLGETIDLTLEVRNQKLLPLTWLEVTDIFSPALPVDQAEVVINRASNLGEFRSFWMPGAFQRLTRHFTIQCTQRGYHTYGPATINTGDGFGLFSRKALASRQDRIIVYPRLYPVAELRLPAKNPFGEHASRLHLFEDPLRTVGIREWRSGDSPRRVHWKASARHQHLLSRVYEPSEEPQILIFLNVATLERHWQGSIPELQERAISVASSLAAYCTELRLPVGLIANGFLPGSDQPIRLLPGRSPGQLVRILELLAAITPFATRPIEELIWREAPRLPWGATLLVVTAIAHDDLLAALLDLSQAGRQVVLFTLAEKPPTRQLPGILVYHLPHLVDDLVAPEEVTV